MKGLHIIADLYGCARGGAGDASTDALTDSLTDALTDSRRLRDICINACRSAGLAVLGEHFYQFDGDGVGQQGGATGAVVLAESHLAVHTWPERDAATLDVYVCNYTADNSLKAEQVYAQLVEALRPADILVERLWRGRDLPLTRKVA